MGYGSTAAFSKAFECWARMPTDTYREAAACGEGGAVAA